MRYAAPLLLLSAGLAPAADYTVTNKTAPAFVVVNKTDAPPVAPAPKAAPFPSSCPGGCPLGEGGCGSQECPGRGWNGACPCYAAKAAPATYPQYLVGGRWVGEAEFRRAYPAAAVGFNPAAVTSNPAPVFLTPAASPCGPNGCPAPATYRRR